MVRARGFDPDTDVVLIPSQVLHDDVVKKFAGEKMSRVSGMRWLFTLGVPHLSKYEASLPYRGAIWRPDDKPDDGTFKKWSDRFGTSGL